MDINCPTCGEPWDTDHLLSDAIYESGLLSDELCEAFTGALDATYRGALESDGWQFADNHVFKFIRCPACISNRHFRNAGHRVETRRLLADLMGDDTDGFISLAEDLDAMSF